MRGELVNASVRDKMQRDKKLTKNSINMVKYLLTFFECRLTKFNFFGRKNFWAELNWTFSHSSPLVCVVQNYFSLNDSFFLLIIYLHHSSYDLHTFKEIWAEIDEKDMNDITTMYCCCLESVSIFTLKYFEQAKKSTFNSLLETQECVYL